MAVDAPAPALTSSLVEENTMLIGGQWRAAAALPAWRDTSPAVRAALRLSVSAKVSLVPLESLACSEMKTTLTRIDRRP